MQRLSQRLWGLFLELVKTITELFDEIDQIQLFERIIQDQELYEKIARLFEPVENIKDAA
ncbi:hypothetical protein GM418_28920 [Maribellus comscasis]|uniref:Uncharacterized protein n=1 Tax=Maribellus comscasis TaxID=2681766 RepID=A0A6I6K4H7_9BACT|nr:hypothetical protein [Maribellus comscasis]QGY47547.1 hypothetical protein GM418_28920 [Maribellus comscasis]